MHVEHVEHIPMLVFHGVHKGPKGCSLTIFGVLVGLVLLVVGLLVPYKLCFDAGSSPSVTSAPDRVFS